MRKPLTQNTRRLLSARLTTTFLSILALCGGLMGAGLTLFAQPAAAATGGPFTCQPGFYQVISGQLNTLDPLSGHYTPIGGTSFGTYNAIGYNPLDNLIYGIDTTPGSPAQDQLVKVDSAGTVDALGSVGLPASIGTYISGGFDLSGNLWVRSGANQLYKVDIAAKTSTLVPTSSTIDGDDMVFINNDLYLLQDTTLYRIDVASGTVTSVTVAGVPSTGTYGAGWTDAAGDLFFSQNTVGQIFKINGYATPAPVASSIVNKGAVTSNNDGASCPTAQSPFPKPVAVDDVYTTPYETTLNITIPGIMVNDSGMTITVSANTNVSHGTVAVNADGSFTYTPSAGFSGVDTYHYTITDTLGQTATATVTITVPGPVVVPTTTTTTVAPVAVEGVTETAAPATVLAGTLPRTGSPSSVPLAETALGLILLGFGLSVVARSRFAKPRQTKI